ncbi:MAG: uracil-DNA glycosylase [Bacteroidetes bacterium HGW-Bacteroidetes-17]|jgi:uracil-DNA glycosylase|nr:MAG: uracil-DNA glycosylase [Bacteroidetes bacterium HGW-Bacteroidetes-17]
MEKIQPQIESSWQVKLDEEFNAKYFHELKRFLLEEKKQYAIYPPGNQIFTAFNLTPFDQVKVVIIGQDPYHGKGQAHGLCFSVARGIKKPPSLINIFKEIHDDLGFEIPEHGNLESWATQGVLLLNATLTVRDGQAGSHQNKGWEIFTDAVIKKLSEDKENLIFLLWGNFAIAKKNLINSNKHHILIAPHPSPLSVHRGFLGCKHFSRANEILENCGNKPINWQII